MCFQLTRRGGYRFASDRAEVIVGSAAMLVACAKATVDLDMFPMSSGTGLKIARLGFNLRYNSLVASTRHRCTQSYLCPLHCAFSARTAAMLLPHCCNGGGEEKCA